MGHFKTKIYVGGLFVKLRRRFFHFKTNQTLLFEGEHFNRSLRYFESKLKSFFVVLENRNFFSLELSWGWLRGRCNRPTLSWPRPVLFGVLQLLLLQLPVCVVDPLLHHVHLLLGEDVKLLFQKEVHVHGDLLKIEMDSLIKFLFWHVTIFVLMSNGMHLEKVVVYWKLQKELLPRH